MQKQKYTTALIVAAVGLSAGSFILPNAEAQAAAPEKQAPSLKVGNPIPSDALAGVTWVQGDAVTALNEPGKVYILECWATWCGPCIAAIPHVNELHRKFADKGLVIIGMNVWEDGLEKAQNFVKKKGDGMSYRVAFSGGRKSAFSDKVMKPAGVTGIPRALVVKDGKLILSIHPGQIDDKMVTSLLDGSFDSVAFAKKQSDDANARAAFIAKLRPLQKANDWAGIKKLANGLEDSSSMKFSLLLRATVMTNNWPDLIAFRKDVKNQKFGANHKTYMVDGTVARDCKITDGAKAYADIALADFEILVDDAKPSKATDHHFAKARMMFISGQTENAKKELATAKEQMEKITTARTKAFYSKMILNAIKKVDEGSFPHLTELLR